MNYTQARLSALQQVDTSAILMARMFWLWQQGRTVNKGKLYDRSGR